MNFYDIDYYLAHGKSTTNSFVLREYMYISHILRSSCIHPLTLYCPLQRVALRHPLTLYCPLQRVALCLVARLPVRGLARLGAVVRALAPAAHLQGGTVLLYLSTATRRSGALHLGAAGRGGGCNCGCVGVVSQRSVNLADQIQRFFNDWMIGMVGSIKH